MKNSKAFVVRGQEIAWLVKHRADDVKALVRNFKKLTRGRQSEFGVPAAYFVSLLELEMRVQRKAKLQQSRSPLAAIANKYKRRTVRRLKKSSSG